MLVERVARISLVGPFEPNAIVGRDRTPHTIAATLDGSALLDASWRQRPDDQRGVPRMDGDKVLVLVALLVLGGLMIWLEIANRRRPAGGAAEHGPRPRGDTPGVRQAREESAGDPAPAPPEGK